LILALARNIATENASLRSGGWQTAVGADLCDKTLGVLGLGSIGSRIAEIGKCLGMHVIAWSQNLTQEKAEASGARLVSKEKLFREADFLTIHLVLSDRSRGLVGKTGSGANFIKCMFWSGEWSSPALCSQDRGPKLGSGCWLSG
jgi:phosphoglycerate dehydrogenase-like enzyme